MNIYEYVLKCNALVNLNNFSAIGWKMFMMEHK